MYDAQDRHGDTLQDDMIKEENKKLRAENMHLRKYIDILENELELIRHGG